MRASGIAILNIVLLVAGTLTILSLRSNPFSTEKRFIYHDTEREGYPCSPINTTTTSATSHVMNSEDHRAHASCQRKIDYTTCSCETACIHIPRETILMNENSLIHCATQQQIPSLGIEQCSYNREGYSSPTLERHIIDLTMKTILGVIYEKWDGQLDGHNWPPDSSKACSMIGLRRMQNLQFLLEETIRLNISGDFIETGVWRGGAAILAATIFKTYGQVCPSDNCRRVFVADSFQGIPAVDVANFPADAAHNGAHLIGILKDNSLERVQATFSDFGVLTDSVIWLKGWFKDTLPPARANFTSFAVARLDGDTYESTIQALENIYDKVSVGGFVIIDDYTDWVGCRQAVDDFRARHGIVSEMRPVQHGVGEQVRGVWWQKREGVVDHL